MSEQDEPKIKVTDKRMFAPDGTLREEYRFLEDETTERAEAPGQARGEAPGQAEPPSGPGAETAAGAPAAEPREPVRQRPEPAQPEPGQPESAPESEPLGAQSPGGGPSFLDLVAALAEPASVYMRNAIQSPAEASQSLEVARLYIDLLDVLRQKTAGNLNVQEKDMLEDALQQLRLGYVHTKG